MTRLEHDKRIDIPARKQQCPTLSSLSPACRAMVTEIPNSGPRQVKLSAVLWTSTIMQCNCHQPCRNSPFTSPNGRIPFLCLPDETEALVPESRSKGTPMPMKERPAPTWPLPPRPPATPPSRPAHRFGKSTLVDFGGFLLANTPATMKQHGWHGTGGPVDRQAAAVGTFFLHELLA